MSDSNITKRALAAAFKELLEEKSFHRIGIADICGRCNMNRNSFYYHFKDKYDLVNWIFDTEFIAAAKEHNFDQPNERWEKLSLVCEYFDENRSFYRKILSVKGQNSLSEHLREILYPVLQGKLENVLDGCEVNHFCFEFFADAIVCAVERWLLSSDYMPPEQFAEMMKRLIQRSAVLIYQDIEEARGDK